MDGDPEAPPTASGAIAEGIIDRFGGIRPMATKLAVPVTTVQGWKKRGIIPQVRHADILAVATRENITIDPAELAATDPAPVPRAEARPAVDPSPEPRPEPIVARPVASTPAAGAPISSAPVASKPVIVRRNGPIAYLALVLALLVGVAGAGAGLVAWQYYLQPLQAKVAALEARPATGNTDDLARRLAKLESQFGQPVSAPVAGAPVPSGTDNDRIAALERQLADLKAGSAQTEQLAKGLSDLQIAAGGRELLAQSIRDIQSSVAAAQGELQRLNGQMTGFGTRLDQVDATLADRHQQALRAEAAILAVGQLRSALSTSKPFAKQLAAVRAMVPGDADMTAVLDQMQPFADTGVETTDDLTRDFGRLAPALVRSAIVGDGQSWWRQALYHIESVISVRRVGADVPGDSTEAVVARAEARLDEDDLQGAIGALQVLTGVAADLASPWIHDAGHRIAVDGAESDLSRLAISRVSSGTPTGAAAPTPSNAADPK
jgi:hypothetical protein